MTYLLVGGAGYIGSHIAELLNQNQKNKVLIYDNLSTGFKQFVEEKSKFYLGDIKDIKTFELPFKENKIDVVIYLAGLTKVGESVKEPLKYYETNILGLVNLLTLCQKYEVNNFVFSSSAGVYGQESQWDGYFKEDDNKKPISAYGRTKYFGEEIIKDYALANPKFHYSFLRYFNAAGASKSGRIGYLTKNNARPTHIIPAISYYAFGFLDDFKIFGNDYQTEDGTCVRDYIHVSELAELHIILAEKMVKDKVDFIFNLGSQKGYSNLEIFNTFQKHHDKKLKLEYGPRRGGDPDVLIADSTKMQKALNYKLQKTLDDIIEDEINFRKNHLRGWK